MCVCGQKRKRERAGGPKGGRVGGWGGGPKALFFFPLRSILFLLSLSRVSFLRVSVATGRGGEKERNFGRSVGRGRGQEKGGICKKFWAKPFLDEAVSEEKKFIESV